MEEQSVSASRITQKRFLALTGRSAGEGGVAWFASSDGCVLGHVVLNKTTHRWDALAMIATASDWIEIEVDEHEFATLAEAERELINFMAALVTGGSDCHQAKLAVRERK